MSSRRRSSARGGTGFGLIVCGLLVAAIACVAYATDALQGLELRTVDARFHVRGVRPPPSDVVFVAMDARTVNTLHLSNEFPRRLHARVLREVTKAKPLAVGYDVDFTGPTDQRDDYALALAVSQTPHPVFAATEVNAQGQTRIFGGPKVLRAIGARAAHAGFPIDPGAVIRKIDYDVDGLKTFPIVLAEAATRHPVKRSDLGGPWAWIDYYGGPHSIRTVSFITVLRGRAPASLFRGKVVVIGPSADLEPHPTPMSDAMGGAEIQATATATVLHHFPLQDSDTDVALLLILAATLIPALAGLWLRRVGLVVIGVIAAAALLAGAQLAFDDGTVIPITYPGLALIAATAIAVAWDSVRAGFTFILKRFAQFVPEAVIDEALARREEDLRTGSKHVVGTVFFSDLRGFTTFAESLPHDRLGVVLNRYLSEVADTVAAHGGTIIDYMGDGVMAVFGAPIERDDHADRALAAAHDMLTGGLPRFNDWVRDEGLGGGFRMGIGLNSGGLLCGNVGSRDRVGFTAIGDTTNVASRLESMTKESPYQLFMAESTRELLRAEPDDLVFVEELPVRGRDATIRVWSLESARASEVRLSGA
jgi:adenylate cyclase